LLANNRASNRGFFKGERLTLSPLIFFMEEYVKSPSASFFVFAGRRVILFCIGLSVSRTGFGGLFGAQTAQEEALGTNLFLYGGAIAILAPILFILALLSGFVLRAKKGWGRVAGIVTSIVSLLDFPMGTAFSIYWLFQFFRR
jgi:hypothetical protein